MFMQKAAQFDPQKASASTWIFAIARNTRIDLLRKSNRPALDPNDPALVPDPPKAAFDTVAVAEETGRIREHVAGLPIEQREVLRLAFEELPHAEVARRLDIPLGTVKSRIRLALRRIRSVRRHQMNIDHHPSEELLLDYATGALDEGWSIALATHPRSVRTAGKK